MRLTYLAAIPKSLYSRAFYREVCQLWQGLGFWYLLLVILLGMIPTGIKYYTHIDQTLFYDQAAPAGDGNMYEKLHPNVQDVLSQIPAMTYKNGVLSTDIEQPYTVYSSETGTPYMIIDTTGTTSSLEGKSADILVTSRFIIMRWQGMSDLVVVEDLAKMVGLGPDDEVVIDQATLEEFISMLQREAAVLPFALYFGLVINLFLTYALFAFFMALIGIMIASSMKLQLEFQQLIRLSAVTATPVLCFEFVELFTGMQIFGLEQIVYFIIHVGFLYYALESNKRTPTNLVA